MLAKGAKASAEPGSDQEVQAMISIAVLCSHLNRGQNPVKYQSGEREREVWK